jgi:hypothetical protein
LQAARPEPQLLGDERPILQVCSPFLAFPIQLLFYQHGNIPSANAAIFRFSDASTGGISEEVSAILFFSIIYW